MSQLETNGFERDVLLRELKTQACFQHAGVYKLMAFNLHLRLTAVGCSKAWWSPCETSGARFQFRRLALGTSPLPRRLEGATPAL